MGGGLVGFVAGQVAGALADSAAEADHREIAAIAAAPRAPVSSHVTCSNCGKVTPRAESVLSLMGTDLCHACSSTYDEKAERRRIEGSSLMGLLIGIALSPVGIGVAYFAMGGRPATMKGAYLGAFLSLIWILPVIVIVFGPK